MTRIAGKPAPYDDGISRKPDQAVIHEFHRIVRQDEFIQSQGRPCNESRRTGHVDRYIIRTSFQSFRKAEYSGSGAEGIGFQRFLRHCLSIRPGQPYIHVPVRFDRIVFPSRMGEEHHLELHRVPGIERAPVLEYPGIYPPLSGSSLPGKPSIHIIFRNEKGRRPSVKAFVIRKGTSYPQRAIMPGRHDIENPLDRCEPLKGKTFHRLHRLPFRNDFYIRILHRLPAVLPCRIYPVSGIPDRPPRYRKRRHGERKHRLVLSVPANQHIVAIRYPGQMTFHGIGQIIAPDGIDNLGGMDDFPILIILPQLQKRLVHISEHRTDLVSIRKHPDAARIEFTGKGRYTFQTVRYPLLLSPARPEQTEEGIAVISQFPVIRRFRHIEAGMSGASRIKKPFPVNKHLFKGIQGDCPALIPAGKTLQKSMPALQENLHAVSRTDILISDISHDIRTSRHVQHIEIFQIRPCRITVPEIILQGLLRSLAYSIILTVAAGLPRKRPQKIFVVIRYQIRNEPGISVGGRKYPVIGVKAPAA